MRPAMTDFTRLAAQNSLRVPEFEAAFLRRVRVRPREDARRRSRVREAISTVAWAYRVGDEWFEAQGHRMISDALSLS